MSILDNSILSVIGFITVIFLFINAIINTIKFIIQHIHTRKMIKELVNSGFLQNTFKKMDKEEAEDLKNKGTGGKTVSYNFDTKKCEIKNEKQEKE